MLHELVEVLITSTKRKIVTTELYLIAAFFGAFALIFFSMAGWTFFAELKGKVIASLVLAAAYSVLSIFCALIAIFKSQNRNRHSDKKYSQSPEDAGIKLVKAFLSGWNAAHGKSSNP